MLLNMDCKIYSHMLAWWLRKPMTMLCSPSQHAFIPSRDIRDIIVVVNSLIDGNTGGIIMMLDWAKAYDLVDHECLEKVLFYMGCSGIGLQRLMYTAKGFTMHRATHAHAIHATMGTTTGTTSTPPHGLSALALI